MHTTPSPTLQFAVETEIQNVFTVAEFGHRLHLDEVAASLPYSKIRCMPNRGLHYSLDDPEATVVMYAKGVIVTMAARSVEQSIKAIRTIIDFMHDLDLEVDDPDISVRNIVANVTTPFQINTELAAMTLKNTTYEPEQFSGMIYRPDSRATVLLFPGGKMTVTGITEESHLDTVAQHTVRMLDEHGLVDVRHH